MAFLVHYVGEGTRLMAGVKEYITIIDADNIEEGMLEERAAGGFEVGGVFEIEDHALIGQENTGNLPTDEILVRKF